MKQYISRNEFVHNEDMVIQLSNISYYQYNIYKLYQNDLYIRNSTSNKKTRACVQ